MAGMAYGAPSGGGGMPGMGGAFAGLSLISTLFGAMAQEKSGKFNQAILDRNARIATYQADDAINRGNVAAKRRMTLAKQTIGSQRVDLAAQGVDVNSGSAAQIQDNTAAIGAIDAQTIKNNAKREAWGYQVNAQDLTLRGQVVRQGGDMEAAQTFLTGSTNLMLAQQGFGQSFNSPYMLQFSRP